MNPYESLPDPHVHIGHLGARGDDVVVGDGLPHRYCDDKSNHAQSLKIC